MFDSVDSADPVQVPPATQAAPGTTAPGVDELQALLGRLASCDGSGADEAGLIDLLTALERLKGGAAAAQARVTATLDSSRCRAEAARDVPARDRCRGLGAEVALARRESPSRGGRHLGMARALVREMPHTLEALTRGDITEYRATLVVKETAVLSREHRKTVDRQLAGTLTTKGDRAVAAAARAIGYRLDPGSALRRTRGANADRHVTLRPAPDTMTYLTGFVPVAQGVACKVALERYADGLRAQGDERSRSQIMADALVERVTGQARADATPVEIALVMTDRMLLEDDHSPAHLDGYGPVPASLARRIVREADHAWLRRLYTTPDRSSLVAMDSRRRTFTGGLRRFLVLRDQVCRTPWCDAPIRHLDHVRSDIEDGETSADNAQGLCESCNYTKQIAGWLARSLADERGSPHTVETTTPTGHRHRSHAPPPTRRVDIFTAVEEKLLELFAA